MDRRIETRKLFAGLIVAAAVVALSARGVGAGNNKLDGISESDAAALNSRAMVFAERNEPERALTFFIAAIKAGAGNGEYWNNLGVCYMRLQRWDDAYVSLQQSIKLGNNDAIRNFSDLDHYLKSIGHRVPAAAAAAAAKLIDQNGKVRSPRDRERDSDDDDTPTPTPTPPPPPPAPATTTNNGGRSKPVFLPKPVYRRPEGLTIRPRRAVPRFTVAELYLPENSQYADGKHPYILTDALVDWPANKKWTVDWFSSTFGDAIVDFYPHNMADRDTHPYLTKMSDALIELQISADGQPPSGKYPNDPYNPGVYLQWNVNPPDWDKLLRDTPSLPYYFRRDEEWLLAAFQTDELRAEFTKKVHWRMILIGSKGAGMFVHMDVLQSASWQAQVVGAKKWFLCSPDQSNNMYGAGRVDVFNPDYATYPRFADADCYETTVRTGELVYYPANYWHQTENQAPVNVAFSSTISDDNNYHLVMHELQAECATGKFKWHFSPELCTAITGKLFPWWKARYDPNQPRPTCSLNEPH